MSACIFFASDAPLPEVFPPPEYDYLAINVDDGTIDDGGAGRPTSRCALTQTVFSIPTKPLPSASTGPTIPRAARGS